MLAFRIGNRDGAAHISQQSSFGNLSTRSNSVLSMYLSQMTVSSQNMISAAKLMQLQLCVDEVVCEDAIGAIELTLTVTCCCYDEQYTSFTHGVIDCERLANAAWACWLHCYGQC